MSNFKIDSSVPLPESRRGRLVYPWRDMDIGDSFFVPNGDQSGISAAARTYGKRHRVKFALRSVTEKGVKGVRAWRIK